MSLQDELNALAEGGSLVAAPQTFNGDLIIPKARLKLTLAGVIVNGGIRRANDGVVGVVIEGGKSVGYQAPAPYQNEQAAVRLWHDWILDGFIAENGNGTGIAPSAPVGQFVRNALVRNCIARNNGRNGIGGARFQKYQVLNCVTNGNNTRKFNPGDEGGGGKYSVGDLLLIDGLKTFDNFGTGCWLDYKLTNYTVRNSEAYGNKNVNNGWEGAGFNTEINEGPGLFENLYAHDNEARGINLWEVMRVIVRNCRCPGSDGLEFRDLTGRAPYHIEDIRLENFQGQIFYSLNMNAGQHAAKKIVITSSTTPPAPVPTPEPPMPIDDVPTGAVYVSGLVPTSVTSGYGPIGTNQSNGENGANDGTTLSIGGVKFAKGLGVHVPSVITYKLDKKYKQFVAYVGVDDEVGARGAVQFKVNAVTSPIKKGGEQPSKMVVDVTGLDTVMLTVLEGGSGVNYGHADWGQAYLVPVGVVPPVPVPVPTPTPVPTPVPDATVRVGVRNGVIVVLP